jgi:hypothetical protein
MEENDYPDWENLIFKGMFKILSVGPLINHKFSWGKEEHIRHISIRYHEDPDGFDGDFDAAVMLEGEDADVPLNVGETVYMELSFCPPLRTMMIVPDVYVNFLRK